MKVNADPEFHPAVPENAWSGGLRYFDREDPAIALPRRDGVGYAPNFAHLSVWFLFIAPLLILFVTFQWIF